MIRKILCFIGYHEWTWKIKEGDVVDMKGSIPKHAFCSHCYKYYGKI